MFIRMDLPLKYSQKRNFFEQKKAKFSKAEGLSRPSLFTPLLITILFRWHYTLILKRQISPVFFGIVALLVGREDKNESQYYYYIFISK